ncbi:MAG TPA: hotdog fold thioesterase [Thermohalobaculum sp.]|nr:hotdog fold thioesterase [Thermohalobaculum sp.]
MTDAAETGLDAYLDRCRARDAYVRLLGIEIEAVRPGRATTRVTVDERHINFFGTAHGGLVFSLADTAFGVAANAAGRLAAMVDAHLTMTGGVLLGDVLEAEAEEASRSRRLAVYRCTVTRTRTHAGDGNGDGAAEVVATFTGTVFQTDRPLDP